MRKIRCYLPGPLCPGSVVVAPATTAHHLGTVLRLQADTALVLFDGAGNEYSGSIRHLAKRTVEIEISEHLPTETESPLLSTLVQAVSKGERMNYTLQKAVELGIQQIRTTFTSRSVPRLSGQRREKRAAHWQGVIISACEQSGRTRLPELQLHDQLALALTDLSTDLKVLLDPSAEQTLPQLPPPQTGVTLLAGPEGGLSDEELALARSEGFIPVRLGPRILRTETAAVAALAVIQSLWGDLSAPAAAGPQRC